MAFVESRVRVRYKETDQMGIAHHSNYIVWFEIGRTDLCRSAGFPYTAIEDRGLIMVRGSVPGVKGGWVSVRDAVKRKLPQQAPKPGAFKAPVQQAAAAAAAAKE